MLSFPEGCGYFASVLFTLTLLPQIVKIVRTRSAEDLSPAFLVIYLLASATMLYYGVCTLAYPVVITNVSGVLASLALIGLYCAYGRNVTPSSTARAHPRRLSA